MTISAAEQLLFELVNRGRLDPLGEAARYGIDLNEGLQPGQIDGTAKQVLAPNALLNTSAEAHSIWVLDSNIFSHTGQNGSSPYERMAAAGYEFTPPWTSGENIAFYGDIRPKAEAELVLMQHKNLFLSSGHRVNLLHDGFREMGVALVAGAFTLQGTTYRHSSILTENFAAAGEALFITGVVHSDSDGDAFYTPGEGVSGTQFSAAGQGALSADAGGYALRLPGPVSGPVSGLVDVEITTATTTLRLALDMAGYNAKLDVVDGNEVRLSASATLHEGVHKATLLGVGDLALTGSGGDDILIGNSGHNLLIGGAGNDNIRGGGGNDMIRGGDGADTIYGGTGNDNIGGRAGNDLIYGGSGKNIIWAGYGDDTVQGGTGSDTIYGGAGRNRLLGNDGDDLIYAGSGGDFIGGGAGNNSIYGSSGADTIYAGFGDDFIGGGAGDDVIYAGAGANRIYGGLGNDTIHGGSGKDVMTGSAGADVFVFASAAHIGIGAGRDVITDFTPGTDDIDLRALHTSFNGTGGLSGGGVASFYHYVPGGILIGDQNGDGKADWVLELTGVSAVTAGDFWL